MRGRHTRGKVVFLQSVDMISPLVVVNLIQALPYVFPQGDNLVLQRLFRGARLWDARVICRDGMSVLSGYLATGLL
jgi:hypothetical protein